MRRHTYIQPHILIQQAAVNHPTHSYTHTHTDTHTYSHTHTQKSIHTQLHPHPHTHRDQKTRDSNTLLEKSVVILEGGWRARLNTPEGNTHTYSLCCHSLAWPSKIIRLTSRPQNTAISAPVGDALEWEWKTVKGHVLRKLQHTHTHTHTQGQTDTQTDRHTSFVPLLLTGGSILLTPDTC